MIDKTLIREFPPMTASLLADNSGVFRVGTDEQHITADDAGTARRRLVELMQAEALRSGAPIRVAVTDPTSVTVLLIDVDGALEEERPVPGSPRPAAPPAAPPTPSQAVPEPPVSARRVSPIQAPPVAPPAAAPRAQAPATPTPAPIAASAPLPAATTAPTAVPATPSPVSAHPRQPVPQDPSFDDAPAFPPVAQQPGTPPQRIPQQAQQPAPPRPAVQQPGGQQGTQQPGVQQPAPPQPFIQQPGIIQPVGVHQPGAQQPGMQQPGSAQPFAPQPAAHPPLQQPAPTARRDLRDAPSFLAPPTVGPAQQGLAGLLNKLGFSVAPSAAERAERDDVHAVSRHFPRRRTISVANQKGGANKTPTVVNLSSVFARYGGGGVAAWDNNETMGTLGWRTEQGGHESTVLDLLAAAGDLLSPGAERADLSRYVHHQPGDKYEVLRSAADGEHVVTADEVDLVHRVLAKYYRLIVMDSGNSAGAPNWRRMVELSDQLVIPTTTVEDKKEGARLTLTAISRVSERGAELARNAVVIVSEAEAKDTSIANAYAEDFRPYVRDVVVVPFDPALKNGVIRHDALRSGTQRAWLAAAAAVSRGL